MDLNKEIRESGLTKQFIAAKIGVSNSQLSQWLNGFRSFPDDKKRQVIDILNKAKELFR